MKFYFYNSYQGSQWGFQMTELCARGEELQLAENLDERIYKSFTAGGIKCILARTTNGKPFFMVRDIRQTDGEGKLWYHNFAAEAENEVDYSLLCGLMRKFCLEYNDFINAYTKFFRKVMLENLSYTVDTEGLYDYLCSTNAEVPNIDTDVSGLFCRMLSEAEHMVNKAEIYLLVTEAGMNYFKKMHSEYQGCKPIYEFAPSDFDTLLQSGIPTHEQKSGPEKPVSPVKGAGSTQSTKSTKRQPEPEEKSKIEISRNQLIAAGIIVVGVAAVVGVTYYLHYRG